MPLTIDYRLIGSGWAECTVRSNEAERKLSASYLSDALGNLVLAAVAMLAGAISVAVPFDEEPGEYRWTLTRSDDNQIALRVIEFPQLWGNRPDSEGVLLLETRLGPLEFGEAVAAAAERVLSVHGLSGYKERWVEHEFPSLHFDLLKSYIAKWREHER